MARRRDEACHFWQRAEAEAEVIAFEIRSDVEVAEMQRAVVRDGVCWRRHRSREHHLPFHFRRAGWCWFLFVFGSVLVAVPCFREASKKESLKFELTVILNFDQNLESEFVFKRIIGIGIRNEYFLK